MFNRISFWNIIKGHYKTLYNDGYKKLHGTHKTPKEDIAIFLLLPIIISIAMVSIGVDLSYDNVNILLTSLSIFAGLMFGMLTLIIDLVRNIQTRILDLRLHPSTFETSRIIQREENKLKIAKELFINTAFEIIVSLITLITLLLTLIRPREIKYIISDESIYECLKWLYLKGINITAYFLLTLFFLTLLMVLKRLYLLYENEINT